MEFDWSEEKNGFPIDKLDRAKYAAFLTDYLSSKKDESYVMNLNAEWGAGKTYFLNRWHNEIKDSHPSAYIDAWKNDFSEEPLLTVISEIFLALESYFNKYPNTKVLKYRKGAIEKSGQFLKSATKEILKHQFKKHAGEEAFEIISPGIEGVSGNITKGLIDSHRDKQKLIDEFKNEIKGWVNNLISESNNEISLPMYIFIDELDRCRPTYAIELLETVKHLFDIEGIVFVVATDTEQLQHSIKAVYGEGFDSSRYLYRFFERSFTLKKPKLEDFIKSQSIYQKSLLPALQLTCDENLMCTEDEVLQNLSSIALAFDFDLRTTNQWLDRVWASLNSEDKRQKYIWIYVAFLSGLKIAEPDLFQELIIDRSRNKNMPSKLVDELVVKYKKFIKNITNHNVVLKYRITLEIAEEFVKIGNGSRIEVNEVEGSTNINFDFIVAISNIFSQGARSMNTSWNRENKESRPNPGSVAYMLFDDRQKQFQVDKIGYIDLVEMASDLT
jgi:hypothetical protein